MFFEQKIVFADTVFSQEIDGEMVLLDMKTENYFGLDAVGSDIWQILREGKTLQETFDELLEMYDVEPEILQNDLQDFLLKLQKSGLIEISGTK